MLSQVELGKSFITLGLGVPRVKLPVLTCGALITLDIIKLPERQSLSSDLSLHS